MEAETGSGPDRIQYVTILTRTHTSYMLLPREITQMRLALGSAHFGSHGVCFVGNTRTYVLSETIKWLEAWQPEAVQRCPSK